MKVLKPLTALFASVAFATAGLAASGPITRLHDNDHDVVRMNNGRDVALPHCSDARGNKVRFSMFAHGAADGAYGPAHTGWSIFSTYLPNRGAEVRMTQDFLDLPYQTAQMVVELECAHHKNGDIYDTFIDQVQGHLPRTDEFEMTLRADCDAAKAVRDQFGFSADDIRAAFAPFPANPPHHPPTAERLEKALACYGNGPS